MANAHIVQQPQMQPVSAAPASQEDVIIQLGAMKPIVFSVSRNRQHRKQATEILV